MFEKILLDPMARKRLLWYVKGDRRGCPSLVLLGEPGIGKNLMAKEIAMWLLELPAGAPPQCSIDYYEVYAETGAELKEQMEEVVSFASFAPVKAPRRVILIHNAHLVKQSLLLKILEDQAETCVFILVTDKELLSTVYSRSILIGVATPTRKALKEYLQENGEQPDDLLLLLSGGRLGSYRKFQDMEDYCRIAHSFLDIFNQMTDKRELLQVCGALKEKDHGYFFSVFDKEQLKGFLCLLEGIFRYNLSALNGVEQEILFPVRPDMAAYYDQNQTVEILFTLEKHSHLIAAGRYSKNVFFDLLMMLVE